MKFLLICCLIALCVSSYQVNYSQVIAGKATQLSSAIYNITKSNKQANRCPHCYPEFEVIKQILSNHILCVIGVDRSLGYIIVVFRGSTNAHNFITNSKILMRQYQEGYCEGCKVHIGFYNSYLYFSQELQYTIRDSLELFPSYGILFTGHSLGGAVATIAAVRFFQINKNDNVQLYTIGQPRVGNQKYADYADSLLANNFRIIHKKDIVPHKPAYLAFYRHSGYEIWYLNGMDSDYQGCKGDSDHCSNSLGGSNFDYSVSDHRVYNYLQLYYDENVKKNLFETFRQNVGGMELQRKLVMLQDKQFELNELFEENPDDLIELQDL